MSLFSSVRGRLIFLTHSFQIAFACYKPWFFPLQHVTLLYNDEWMQQLLFRYLCLFYIACVYQPTNIHYRIYSIVSRGLWSCFSSVCVRLIRKGGLHFMFLYLIERYRWFLGYVLSTKLSFRILFSSASCAHSSQEALWWTEGSCSGEVSPVATGGFGGLTPPKQSSNPQIET